MHCRVVHRGVCTSVGTPHDIFKPVRISLGYRVRLVHFAVKLVMNIYAGKRARRFILKAIRQIHINYLGGKGLP